jgi:hypothetical protein
MANFTTKKILSLLEGESGAYRLKRFWAKVERGDPDACWNWTASLTTGGYGRFKLTPYEMALASRVALIAHTHSEPAGLMALHTCDNPRCCNPGHLYFGTHQDNMDDKVARGRCYNGDQRGALNGRSKLSVEQLELVIKRLRAGWTNTAIAADLPITHGMVSLIRRGKMWKRDAEALGWFGMPSLTAKAA